MAEREQPAGSDTSPPKPSDRSSEEVTDETVVTAASDAAEAVIFDRYRQSQLTDLDITVTFEDGILEVDVYLNAPDDEHDPEAVATEAVEAAEAAVDELFESAD